MVERFSLLCNLGITEEPSGLMDTVWEPYLRTFLMCPIYLRIEVLLFKPVFSAQDGACNPQ